MKKAMLQAAGTAVLGVALAAAAVTPAAADALGGALGGLPTGGLPNGLAGTPNSEGGQVLGSQNASVHAVTGTAQGLVNAAAPSVQNAAQAVSGLSQATSPTRGLPGGLPVGLPGVGSLPVSSLPGLGAATQALPVPGGLAG